MNTQQQDMYSAFRERAQAFCQIVESAAGLERKTFLDLLETTLAQVYAAAVVLPFVELATSSLPDSPFSVEQWSGLWQALRNKLGAADPYRGVFDPTEKEEAIDMSLSQDISEIYEDLKEALELERKGVPEADLRWSWHFDFRDHWGRHAVNALNALHWHIYWDH